MKSLDSLGISWEIKKQSLFYLIVGLFFAPYIALVIWHEDYTMYRITHLSFVVGMIATMVLFKIRTSRLSWQAFFISTAVLLSTVAVILRDGFSERGLDELLLIQSIFFIAIIVTIDRIRSIGLQQFLGAIRPLSIVFVVLSAFWFIFNPEIVHGRYNFLGLHPNLGGELLFAAMIPLAFSSSRTLRISIGTLILGMLFLLQSRAALISASIIVLYAEWFHYFRFRGELPRLKEKIGVLLILIAASVAIIALTLDDPVTATQEFIEDNVLLLSDPHRGIETGFVGREDRWNIGVQAFLDSPIFGSGIGQIREIYGSTPHNGFLNLIAEVGIFAIPIFWAMWVAIKRAWTTKQFLYLAILIGSAFVFFFSDRSFNVNAFPLIMWMLILPWAIQETTRSRSDAELLELRERRERHAY